MEARCVGRACSWRLNGIFDGHSFVAAKITHGGVDGADFRPAVLLGIGFKKRPRLVRSEKRHEQAVTSQNGDRVGGPLVSMRGQSVQPLVAGRVLQENERRAHRPSRGLRAGAGLTGGNAIRSRLSFRSAAGAGGDTLEWG